MIKEGVVAAVLEAIAKAMGCRLLAQERRAAWPQEGDAEVAVFSYARDFSLLWGVSTDQEGLPAIGRALRARIASPLKLVVVWDGVPSSDIPIVNWTRYLTPIDWAVALSLAIDRAGKDQAGDDTPETDGAWTDEREYPALSVVIFDLASHYTDDADGLHFARQFATGHMPALPWIRLFGPVDRAPWPGAEHFLEALKAEGDTMGKSLPGKRHDLELVGRLWTSTLTRPSNPDDHHAIANLLAPQLLLGAATTWWPADRRMIIGALRALADSLGLLGKPGDGGSEDAWIDWNSAVPSRATWGERVKAALGRAGTKALKVLIVDDQWQDGWGEVVCRALGIPYAPENRSSDEFRQIGMGQLSGGYPQIVIKAVRSAEALVERIKDGNRYTLQLDPEAPEGLEIALVDLRLYAGRDVKDEAQFVQRLIPVVRARETGDELRSQSWGQIDSDEIERIKEWAAEAIEKNHRKLRHDRRYYEALALLPRLIAQSDPSYPVILFSSTGRREILAKLIPYRNILTTFEKPRLDTALAGDVVAQARAGFVNAFDQALDLCAARTLIAGLPNDTPNAVQQGTTHGKGDSSHWTIEIYLDETGSEVTQEGESNWQKPLTVGGVLAVYSPGTKPEDFDEDLRTIPEITAALSDNKGKEKIRQERDSIMRCVVDKARKKGITFAVISLSGTLAETVYGASGYGAMDDVQVADNLWRELSSCVIELAAYHYARPLCPAGANAQYGVYLPTRHLPLGKDPAVREKRKKILFNTWGIQTVYTGQQAPLWQASEELARLDVSVGEIKEARVLLDQAKSNYQEPEELVRYFNFDSARPLVQRLAAQYRHAIFTPQAEHARAYLISNACGRPWVRFVRVLHLLADVVVDPKTSVVDDLSVRGFRGTYGDDLQIVLRASRLLAHGLPGEALAACADLAGYGSGPVDVIHQLAGSLRRAANAMPLEQLDVLVGTIRGRRARTVAAGRQIEGHIESIERAYHRIRGSDGILYKCGRLKNETLRRGDTVALRVRRTLYGETEIVDVQFKARHPKWDEIRVDDVFTGRVAAVLTWGTFIDVGRITGKLNDRCLERGQSVRVRVKHIDKQNGQLTLVLA